MTTGEMAWGRTRRLALREFVHDALVAAHNLVAFVALAEQLHLARRKIGRDHREQVDGGLFAALAAEFGEERDVEQLANPALRGDLVEVSGDGHAI